MIHLFEFNFAYGKKLFLTSSNNPITVSSITYLPNSSLSLESLRKSDLFKEAIISGFYEKNGIEKSHMIDNSHIKISRYDVIAYLVASLEFEEINNDGIEFKLKYISKSSSLNRNLLARISRTCRASLGDKRCKLDISKFLEKHKLLSIDKNKIIIYKGIRPDGFFDGGKLLGESGKSYNIISYKNNEVIIDGTFHEKENSEIILHPSCDKEFSTCASKFHNTINFRGEPFIGKDYER